jgi:hypothetical protein
MSAEEEELHARCIRQDEDGDSYPLDLTVERRVHDGIEWAEGDGLNELCDEAYELVEFILSKPTPHARYATMVAVIGNLLAKALGLEPVERTPPPTTTEAQP